jgi:hypothetical protein
MMREIEDITTSQMITLSKNFGCNSSKWLVHWPIQYFIFMIYRGVRIKFELKVYYQGIVQLFII